MIVTGIIIRRKSFGKWLAFATLKILSIEFRHDDENHNSADYDQGNNMPSEIHAPPFDGFDGVENVTIKDEPMQTIRIVFQRDSPFWGQENENSHNLNDRASFFPTKNALLPYGAKVKAHLRKRNPDNKSGCKHEVCSWEIIDDPRSIAYEEAKLRSNMSSAVCNLDVDASHNSDQSKNPGEEGVYLHKYLKTRGDYYLKYNNYGDKKKVKKVRNNQVENNPHGDKKAKSHRAKTFASWLVDEFSPNLFKQYGGVLDIAGGKGNLSVELSILVPEVQCTVIDPFIRCRSAGVDGSFLPNKELKRIQRVSGTPPKHLAKYFRNNDESNDAVERCSFVVGLHPDQPTEDIVDIALQKNKPFAVIPCCVFPCLFPMRLLSSGKNVVHYEDFMQYLMEKDDRLKQTTLNFEGKNRVIYFKG